MHRFEVRETRLFVIGRKIFGDPSILPNVPLTFRRILDQLDKYRILYADDEGVRFSATRHDVTHNAHRHHHHRDYFTRERLRGTRPPRASCGRTSVAPCRPPRHPSARDTFPSLSRPRIVTFALRTRDIQGGARGKVAPYDPHPFYTFFQYAANVVLNKFVGFNDEVTSTLYVRRSFLSRS